MGEYLELADALETAYEIEILEDGPIAKATELLECLAGGELGLVAQRRAGEAGPQSDHARAKAVDRTRVVEPDQKAAAHPAGVHRAADAIYGICRQEGVGVKKEKYLGGRLSGSPVELGTPPGGSFNDRYTQLASDGYGAIPAPTVADHDLVGDAENRGEMSSEPFLFVEGGNDDGDTCAGQIGEMLA